jgi:hypothetical protein
MVVNVAVTERDVVIDTTHVPAPVHAPDHPENTEPTAASADSTTDVPNEYDVAQLTPQSIPDGNDVTNPSPSPTLDTDNNWSGGGGM